MRIVLLGGSGFLGYHIGKHFSKSHEVVCISRKPPINTMIVSGVKYINGDCGNEEFLKSSLKTDDIILYLAYSSIPKTSFEHPLEDITENLPMAVTIFSVLKEISIKRIFVFSSGGTVYGDVDLKIPIKENHETNPLSPYGITKLSIEKYAKLFHKLYSIPIVIVRPSNPYGSFQLPFRGQGFIPTAIASIINDKDIGIFGEFGTVRDYLFIDDFVSAIGIIINSDISSGEILNIGSGMGFNNLEIVNILRDISEKRFKINILPERQFDVMYNVLDITKLKNLGWLPKVSIQEGLLYTWEWFVKL